MPDIDMDFDSRSRGEMIRYAAERYGADHVAQIVTFSTIKARAAVRDASRVLGYPYGMGDRIANLMPPAIMGRDTPLGACLELVPGQEDGYKMATELRDLYGVDPDAKRVIHVARRGDTVGVFQLEGAPVRSLLQRLAPTSFDDIAPLVALYRPGPMAQNWHTEYADRRNGRRPVDYPHPDLEEILAPTYGLMIYQEQMMRVAQKLAGYTLEEADNLRKATGKKIRALIVRERSKFVDGCVAQGHDRAFGERIFDTIEPFADYSFNKSHSVGYGYLAYQTAFLKANYPPESLAAPLTTVRTNKDQTAVFLNECRQLGIPVLVPHVNESVSDFSVHLAADGPRSIPFGLSALPTVGPGVVAILLPPLPPA